MNSIKKFLVIAVLVLCYSGKVLAQGDFLYQPIVCSGPVPEDFYKLSTDKYLESKEKYSGQNKNTSRRSFNQFLLENSFGLSEILHSGLVIYGDPVTRYLNNIKDELLKSDPDTKTAVRIYTLRSDIVNAYTTSEGIIFVTMGLVAHCKNEAEIAFILGHEITHFKKKHVLKEFYKKEEIKKKRRSYKESFDEADLAYFGYSKEVEKEADAGGLEIFLKSNYSIKAIPDAFDMLLYADYPFANIPLPLEYFESKDSGYVIPDDYYPAQVNPITAKEDEDDTISTHPNVKTRKEFINAKLPAGDDAKKIFIQPEDTFDKILKMCRYDLCWHNITIGAYENAYYEAYLLSKDNPNDVFLQEIMNYALYALAKYKAHGDFSDVHVKAADGEGEVDALYYLMGKLPIKELKVLALRENIIAANKYKDAPFFKALAQNLFIDLRADNEMTISDFYEKYDPAKSTDTSKAKKKSYFKYALAGYSQTDITKDIWGAAKREAEENASSEKNGSKYRYRWDYTRIPITDIVLINPFYSKYDNTNDKNFKYVAAETSHKELVDYIKADASNAGVNVHLVDFIDLNQGDAKKFNQIIYAYSWIREKSRFSDISTKFIAFNAYLIKEVGRENGSDNIALLSISSGRTPKEDVAYKLCIGCIYPLTLVDVFTPEYETSYSMLVLNISSGRYAGLSHTINMNDYTTVNHSNIYNLFHRLKKGKYYYEED